MAPLPFEYHGPWLATVNMLDGVTVRKIGTDYDDKYYDGRGDGAAKFNDETSFYQIHFDDTPDELSYMLRGNSLGSCICTAILVRESADGANWNVVAEYETKPKDKADYLNSNTITNVANLKPDSRYVEFAYKDASKGFGSIGVDAIVITKAEGGEPVKTTVTGGNLSFTSSRSRTAPRSCSSRSASRTSRASSPVSSRQSKQGKV
ncbi:MAG: hypothetical protein IKQ55_03880 [Kiritimatiellae bacterium]|nr:hypothetical protein [Kiritimatiellia bacterium]